MDGFKYEYEGGRLWDIRTWFPDPVDEDVELVTPPGWEEARGTEDWTLDTWLRQAAREAAQEAEGPGSAARDDPPPAPPKPAAAPPQKVPRFKPPPEARPAKAATPKASVPSSAAGSSVPPAGSPPARPRRPPPRPRPAPRRPQLNVARRGGCMPNGQNNPPIPQAVARVRPIRLCTV